MPAIIRIPVEGNIGTRSVNVWHWLIPMSSPVTEAGAAVTALAAFYNAIKANLFAQTFTIGNRIVTVDQATNTQVFAAPLTVVTTGATTAPLSTAVVASLKSTNVGPRYRGRVYLGPVTPSVINGDGRTINAGITSTWNTALTTLVGTVASGIQLVIYSRKFNTSIPVIGANVSPIAGVMRKRLT